VAPAEQRLFLLYEPFPSNTREVFSTPSPYFAKSEAPDFLLANYVTDPNTRFDTVFTTPAKAKRSTFFELSF